MKLIFAGVNRYLAAAQLRFDVLRVQPQFRCVHPHTNTPDCTPGLILFDIGIKSMDGGNRFRDRL